MSLICPAFVNSYDPTLCIAIDNYCERTSDSLLAEPLNALTIAAFLITAWLAWKHYRQQPRPVAVTLIPALISAMVFVGLGSFLFHTVATRWAEWGDVRHRRPNA